MTCYLSEHFFSCQFCRFSCLMFWRYMRMLTSSLLLFFNIYGQIRCSWLWFWRWRGERGCWLIQSYWFSLIGCDCCSSSGNMVWSIVVVLAARCRSQHYSRIFPRGFLSFSVGLLVFMVYRGVRCLSMCRGGQVDGAAVLFSQRIGGL